MSLQFDPELLAATGPLAEKLAAKPQLPVGDVNGRRQALAAMFQGMAGMFPDVPEVTRKDHSVEMSDGVSITITELRPVKGTAETPSKAIYYIHGGGMIMGSVDAFQLSVKRQVLETGFPAFGVGYRLAPEHPHPTPKNAVSLGVDPARIVLEGGSAGGGLTAGVAFMARDNKLSPPLLKQVLIFPMLDDRNNTPLPELHEFSKTVWSTDDNLTGWKALLGDKAGDPDPKAVSEYAAPARTENLAGLPPTYIECGQLDIFVYEDMRYATRLVEAQVLMELHIYPGQPHGFQMFAGSTMYAKMAGQNTVNAIKNA